MKCLICKTPDDERPTDIDDQSEFEILFGHIVRRFPDDKWSMDLQGCWPFHPLAPDEVESGIDHHFKNGVIAGRHLAEYMRWLNDLDLGVYHLPPNELAPSPELMLVQSPCAAVDLYLPVNFQHAFLNHDGAYWRLVTEDERSIASVRAIWHLTEVIELRTY